MLPFRRAQALLVALIITLLFLFLRNSHSELPPLEFPEPQSGRTYDEHTSTKAATKTPINLAPLSEPIYPVKSSHDPAQAHAQGRQQQISLADLADKPLRQKLALRFPYYIQDKFPPYIWQTWRVTPADHTFPEAWRSLEASWSELHQGFVHEVIDDDSALHVLRHLYSGIPEPIAAYEALDLPVLKADFFRYLILLARGGIYSDIDTQALKSAYTWVPESVSRSSYGLVVGIEADPDREDWSQWYARRIQFCQWTIQSKPGHPVLLDIVVHITEEALKRKRSGTLKSSLQKDDGVMEFTGPGVWTDAIFNYLNDPKYFDLANSKLGNISWKQFTGMTTAKKVGDVVVLPITSFSPGVAQMGAGEIDDPMAFVHHNFYGSWKPEADRHIGEINDQNSDSDSDSDTADTSTDNGVKYR